MEASEPGEVQSFKETVGKLVEAAHEMGFTEQQAQWYVMTRVEKKVDRLVARLDRIEGTGGSDMAVIKGELTAKEIEEVRSAVEGYRQKVLELGFAGQEALWVAVSGTVNKNVEILNRVNEFGEVLKEVGVALAKCAERLDKLEALVAVEGRPS